MNRFRKVYKRGAIFELDPYTLRTQLVAHRSMNSYNSPLYNDPVRPLPSSLLVALMKQFSALALSNLAFF